MKAVIFILVIILKEKKAYYIVQLIKKLVWLILGAKHVKMIGVTQEFKIINMTVIVLTVI